jgi:hypothetical protein
MNKQKKISPHSTASRQILSLRSTKMRDMQTNVSTINSFGTTISSFVPSSSVPINRLDYTKEQLTKFIKDNPNYYCNEIMGVSCKDGWTGNDWNNYGPYAKWYLAEGRCRFWQTETSSCPSGCWFWGCA